MPPVGSAGLHRTAAVAAFAHLGLWCVLILAGHFLSGEGARHALIGATVGGHVPVWWLRWAMTPLLLWLLADLFFIRRAPPELRKAQWATSILTILLYATLGGFLDSLCRALDFVARQA